ncbi:MAG: trypsin-like serine protease [Muricauda sp.]|nr:trypsin-like serine protease [Allomuricauda sp.]MBA4745990.1 trypsin-like serine protease [Allomuricauda sp.]
MKSKHCLLIAALVIMCSSFIVTRHDTKDEEYIVYGRRGFESLAVFEDGNGTLIDEQWVLTARHIADNQKPGSIVAINGAEFKVEEVVLYPQKPTDDLFEKKDLGLIKLNQKVKGVAPVKCIKKSPKIGSILYLAGNGDMGNGKTGPILQDKKIRAATNTLDSLKDHFISFVFDPPDSGKATKLEGIPGPGDSGGPAYIKENDVLVLAGVSSFELIENSQNQGRYGARNYYPNVSFFADWIESTIKGEDYYKTNMDGKEIVSIKRVDGSYYLEIDGKKASKVEIMKYGEKVLKELQMVKTSSTDDIIDVNNPIIVFRKYIENVSGFNDVNKVGGFKLDKYELRVGDKTMPTKIKDQAIKKFEELFGRPLGNNQINAKPSN